MTRELCPSCDAPLATAADHRDDDTPRPGDDALCWRLFHNDVCQRPAVDWRARYYEVLAGQPMVRRLMAERDEALLEVGRVAVTAHENVTAYRDAQAMLEEVAAERDALEARRSALVREVEYLQSAAEEFNHRRTKAERRADGRLRAIRALRHRAVVAEGEQARLEERRQAHLKMIADLSQSTPLASELEGWEAQRAALLVEVGTLRAQAAETERERDEWERLARSNYETTSSTIDVLTAERDRLRDALVYLRDEYSPLSSRPCPACVYVDGRLQRRCKLHEEIDGARAAAVALESELESTRIERDDFERLYRNTAGQLAAEQREHAVTRLAVELGNAALAEYTRVIEPLTAISDRIGYLTLRSGLSNEVWSDLCRLHSDVLALSRHHLRVAGTAGRDDVAGEEG